MIIHVIVTILDVETIQLHTRNFLLYL